MVTIGDGESTIERQLVFKQDDQGSAFVAVLGSPRLADLCRVCAAADCSGEAGGPKPRKKQRKAGQAEFMPREAQELSTAAQEYDVNGFINEIRGHVETWRAHRPENGHWQRQDDRHGDADRLANVNAVRTPGSNLYSRGFLEVAPASPSRTVFACCSRTIQTAVSAAANWSQPTCCRRSARPRSSSPTSIRSNSQAPPAERLGGSTVAKVVRESLQPCCVLRLQLQQFGDGILPAPGAAAMVSRTTHAHNRHAGGKCGAIGTPTVS